MKAYEVQSCTNRQTPYLEPAIWQQANLLDDFCYPWRNEVAPCTQFRALHNAFFLYFHFEVEEEQLIAAEHKQIKQAVVQSDRVELFFRKDKMMAPYYCLEMDWKGRLLDNQAWYHRQMDYDWEWPQGLHFRSSLSAKGYTVEGALSKQSLQMLGLLKNQSIEAGIFRAEFQKSPQEQVKWISWVSPDTLQADFHVPSAFGLLKLI